ncbi:RNA degradosome polyphosphate kinase, partial [Nocardia gipuzkoensis]
RGICGLRPGVPGMSDNIQVRSILGRFLEHSRVLHFQAQDEFWIGSADMMHRNLDRRVEVMAQVKDPRLCEQLGAVFDSALNPATRCWVLQPDGSWLAEPDPDGDGPVDQVRDHQEFLMRLRRPDQQ